MPGVPDRSLGRFRSSGSCSAGPVVSIGGNVGLVRHCPSGQIRCDFVTICGKAGLGADVGVSVLGTAAVGARCSGDIESFTLGLDFDVGGLAYGSVGVQVSVSDPSSLSGRIAAGIGAGISGGVSGCGAIKIGCTKR